MRARAAWRYLSAAALLALALAGCGGKSAVTLYLPSEGGLVRREARAEATPEGLLAALTEAGALPEADWTYLYCRYGTESWASGGRSEARAVVRLDIADALGEALKELEDERPAVQALANTFLDFYDAEIFVLTVEGVNLQTLRAYYDHGIVFDEYAGTE
ncbi:MAG: hypothetical protein Q4C13_00165 [Clostridia bacterium]|nr:hypothetical protein [Clostridia bacterium]